MDVGIYNSAGFLLSHHPSEGYRDPNFDPHPICDIRADTMHGELNFRGGRSGPSIDWWVHFSETNCQQEWTPWTAWNSSKWFKDIHVGPLPVENAGTFFGGHRAVRVGARSWLKWISVGLETEEDRGCWHLGNPVGNRGDVTSGIQWNRTKGWLRWGCSIFYHSQKPYNLRDILGGIRERKHSLCYHANRQLKNRHSRLYHWRTWSPCTGMKPASWGKLGPMLKAVWICLDPCILPYPQISWNSVLWGCHAVPPSAEKSSGSSQTLWSVVLNKSDSSKSSRLRDRRWIAWKTADVDSQLKMDEPKCSMWESRKKTCHLGMVCSEKMSTLD